MLGAQIFSGSGIGNRNVAGEIVVARPTWKGFLKLSLVSIPVKAFTVRKSDSGEIHLNQLHRTCHNRIRYQKTCPVHGEVPSEDIIMGYAVSKDRYVPIDPDELKLIRRKSDQSIEIDTFIAAEELDDRYLSDRSYYLLPDGKVAQKPYALVRRAIEENSLVALAEVVLSSREHLVMVRPLGKLLVMTVLQYQAELKEPSSFTEEVEDLALNAQELLLTKQLVSGFIKEDWDYAQYSDKYQTQLAELVASKIEGKQLVQSPQQEAPMVINLMDALKASLKRIPVPRPRNGSPLSSAIKSGRTSPSDAASESQALQSPKTKPKRVVAKSAPRKRTPSKKSRNTG